MQVISIIRAILISKKLIMNPIIKQTKEKNLVGKKMKMSFDNFRIGELWKSFMPLRLEMQINSSNDLFSLAVYSPNHFKNFSPVNEFEKWAAIEVSDFNEVPDGMETFLLQSGLYAVFAYKGLHSDNSIYQYIFGSWLPNSDYMLDDRPHFELLGEKYKNDDPNSEEEIWIPIKLK